MASELLQRLAEEVKLLSPEEQGELKLLLERALSDEVTRRLMAKGMISRLPGPRTEADLERLRSWKPIVIQGKPLSETVIEDKK
jgi:hypothetical protein